MNRTLSRWHEFIAEPNAEILNEILSENVRFHSPFVWKPKDGKMIASAILLSAVETFRNFRYIREIAGENQFCLEFEATVGEFSLRGVDLIALGDDGNITDFEVMIRPANALQKLGAEMSLKLTEKGLI